MIHKIHYVSLTVNGREVDLFSQEDLNLRINNVLYDPTEIKMSDAEYSFSFDLPISPTNQQIFGFADNLAVLNKFNKKFNCVVYADGIEIFNGTLRLSAINKDAFKCNLVSIKLNKVDEIFADHKMNELKWYVPFVGGSTMNAVNADLTTDYFFPLVSYGCFQKLKKNASGNSLTGYTPKHDLDNWNVWYWESFAPSVKLTTLIKKLFEYRGYNVSGDIFDDPNANAIYLSEYLKDKQDPLYNLGNSKLGQVEVAWTFDNDAVTTRTTKPAYAQSLTYPYAKVGTRTSNVMYNFDTVYNYDVWAAGSKYTTITNTPNPYMWRSNYIMIPADGLYKITFNINFTLDEASTSMDTWQWKIARTGADATQEKVTITKDLKSMPIEFQLVRNENDTELIAGDYDGDYSVYPHEQYVTIYSSRSSSASATGNLYINTIKEGEALCYDPWVNPNFICGFSTLSGGVAYMKNGMSWNNESAESNIVRYNHSGYWEFTRFRMSSDGRLQYVTEYNSSEWNANSLTGVSSDYLSSSGTYSRIGKVQMVMKLNKNDKLMLKMLTRQYTTSDPDEDTADGTGTLDDYSVSASGTIKVEAYSPLADKYADDSTLGWDTIPTGDKFDTDLNLGNFFNADEKMADFVEDFINSFNLSYQQDGNNVILNKTKKDFQNTSSAIDIDDRVHSSEAESQRIEYPSSMEIQYSIDEDERGFYISVPNEYVELDSWKDYADRGYETIQLVDDDDAESEDVSLKHSYTWYENFNLYQYDSTGTATANKTISLPVISKDEYLIEGYKYEDSMKVDGKGLKQRWWYRQAPTTDTLKLWNGETYNVTIPTNEQDGNVLNYKNEDGSLLKKYFNIIATPDSNLVVINVYITPQEYIELKNGSMVKFDDDLYYVCEIGGYDPSGNNATELTLLKKV